MANFATYNGGRLTHGEQRFFLNQQEIPGIQTFNANYDISAQFLKYIGVKDKNLVPRGAQIGSFSLSTLLISDDYWINYTGKDGFNGYLLVDKSNLAQNFSFTSGYLSSYTSRGSIGQIPQVEVNGSVFGNMGRFASSESSQVTADYGAIPSTYPTGVLKIPGPGSISISIEDFISNRVQSYELNISIPRNPVYSLGQRNPYCVEINYPIELTADFTVEIFDYTGIKMQNFPLTPKVKDLTLGVYDYNTFQPISVFNFGGMTLVSEKYSAGISSNSTIQLTYKSYLTR